MKRRKMRAIRVEQAKRTGKILLLEAYFSAINMFFALSYFTRQPLMQIKYEKTPKPTLDCNN